MTYTSHAEEQALKDAIKAKRATKYLYEPVGMDIFKPCQHSLKKGDIVVKVQPSQTPRNGTMGQCYVGDPISGEFRGMVSMASLIRCKQSRFML